MLGSLAFTCAGVAAEAIPGANPAMFRELVAGNFSVDWIEPAARDELTVGILREISGRLNEDGGAYEGAEKAVSGWRLHFENGTVRARIIRSKRGLLVGVFFSGVE